MPPSLKIIKQNGYLNGKEYIELVNPLLIKHIIDAGLCKEKYDLTKYTQKLASKLYLNEANQLSEYMNKYKKIYNGIPVKYLKAKHGYGRVFPVKSLGLTSLVKKTRNTLIKDNMIDVDMSNAQPSIILNLAKANNIPCPFNEEYITNREKILADVIAEYGVTRDDAKGLFIRLAFSGTFKGWCRESGLNEFEFDPNEFIKGFTQEIYKFAGIIKENNPELYKCVKDCKDYKGIDTNLEGSTLALYLQEYEFRIADCVCEFLDNKTNITTIPSCKLKALTYEFDGFKLLKSKVLDYGSIEFLISTIETYVFDKLGFKMKFEVKPIEKFYKIENVFVNEPIRELSKDEIKQQQIIEKREEQKNLLEQAFKEEDSKHTLPSGEIIDFSHETFNAVENDLDAVKKLYKLYPHFVYCQGELFVFSFKNGLYSNDKTSFLSIIQLHEVYLHTLVYSEKEQDWVKNERVSYGNTVSLMEKLIPLLKTMNVNNDWLKIQESTSLGKLLFKNGYYDFKEGLFYSNEKYGYNPKILFVFCVPHNFEELNEDDIIYMNTIKTRIFHNPLDEELGNYMILNLARGLSGEIMKRFIFCLGGTNGGKSILTDAISLSCGDYAGVFNAENLAYRQSSSDEGAQLRWALLLRFKRIIMSNEIKNGDGEKPIALNSNMMKKCSSGGDALIGRTHCKEEQSFIPHFLTVCFANDIPNIKPYDDAINGRLKVISFNKTFVTEVSNQFELKMDIDIKDELKTIRFQRCFMMLLLQYYADWNDLKKKEGYIEFEPIAVTNGKKAWIKESEGFLVTFFKDFEITSNENDKVKSSDIDEWIKQTKLLVSMTKFSIELKKYMIINNFDKVYSKDFKVFGKTTKWWVGIKRLYDIDDGVVIDDKHL